MSSSVFRARLPTPKTQYISLTAFSDYLYTYKSTFSTPLRRFVGTLTLTTLSDTTTAARVILQTTGVQLIPGINDGITTRMISVRFLGADDNIYHSGYIDPLTPEAFALYTEHGLPGSTASISENDMYSSAVNTSGLIKGIGGIDISGNSTVDGDSEVSGDLTVTGRIYQEAGTPTPILYMLVPIGCIMSYIGASAPDGYLLCIGTAVNRTTYADLFGIIGTVFGVGDGTTTFNIPDMRGRMISGQGSGQFATIGATSGATTATLTTTELPAHTHTGTTNSSGIHDHGGVTGATGSAPESETVATGEGAIVAGADTHTHTISPDGSHTHTFTTDSSGTGSAFSIMNPFMVLTFIIKY